MSFERPTLAELVTRIQADFVSRLRLTGALLRRAVVYVMARVWAGAVHMLHGHLDFLARQLFPDTSEVEYLERQAALYSITRNAATFAEGTADITGTNGTPVPAGTTIVRSDGVEYTTDALVTIALGVGTLALTCEDAGADGTLTVADVLTFESPITGVDATVTVTASTTDGTDEESDDDLRERVIERTSETSGHGGTESDWVAWAKEVTGVTRVWVDPQGLGPGTVVVRFARDDDASPIPSAGEVSDVQDVLDENTPVHCEPTAVAPTDAALAVTVAVLPNTSTVQDAVEAELADMLLREGEPGGTIQLWQIRQAIGNAAGLASYVVAIPAADVTHTENQLPSLGTVTFT